MKFLFCFMKNVAFVLRFAMFIVSSQRKLKTLIL